MNVQPRCGHPGNVWRSSAFEPGLVGILGPSYNFRCKMNQNRTLPQPLVETIAGFTAGVATTVVVHPLDLLKTRLQGQS